MGHGRPAGADGHRSPARGLTSEVAPVGAKTPPVRWGFGTALGGWVLGLWCATVAVLGARAIADLPAGSSPLWLDAVGQAGQSLGLFATLLWASTRLGTGRVPDDFWCRVRPIDLPGGFALGVACQVLLVPAVYWPVIQLGWLDESQVSERARALTDQAKGGADRWLLAAMVIVAAPIVEELFYRGLVQRAAERRFRWPVSLLVTAALFAGAHFAPIQFPALFLFALVLGLLVRRTGRLGPSIATHMGFNATSLASLIFGWKVGM